MLNALYKHNDLLLHLVSYLSVPSLISLYAISKPFHYLFNSHYTAYILSCMRTWSPDSDKIYPWRCYKSLCIRDPAKRSKAKWTGKENELVERYENMRDVPSLRWLQMVIWREGVCRDMLIQLAVKAHRCPRGTKDALKRMWFLMDLPLNAHRIALIRSQEYLNNKALFYLTHFFLKVDMRFTDPVVPIYEANPIGELHHPHDWTGGGFVGCDLRELLLAEKHLTPLWRVLRGWSWDWREPQVPMTRLDMLRLWVRHKYTVPADTAERVKKQSIMGVPWWEVGKAGHERIGVEYDNFATAKNTAESAAKMAATGSVTAGKGRLYPHAKRLIVPMEHKRERLLGPDELLLRESIRRKLQLHKQWVRMMCWGYCDPLGRPVPLRTEEEFLRIAKGLPPKPTATERKDAEAGPNTEATNSVAGRRVMVETAMPNSAMLSGPGGLVTPGTSDMFSAGVARPG